MSDIVCMHYGNPRMCITPILILATIEGSLHAQLIKQRDKSSSSNSNASVIKPSDLASISKGSLSKYASKSLDSEQCIFQFGKARELDELRNDLLILNDNIQPSPLTMSSSEDLDALYRISGYSAYQHYANHLPGSIDERKMRPLNTQSVLSCDQEVKPRKVSEHVRDYDRYASMVSGETMSLPRKRHEWMSGNIYRAGDRVIFENQHYVCTYSNKSLVPPSFPWKKEVKEDVHHDDNSLVENLDKHLEAWALSETQRFNSQASFSSVPLYGIASTGKSTILNLVTPSHFAGHDSMMSSSTGKRAADTNLFQDEDDRADVMEEVD